MGCEKRLQVGFRNADRSAYSVHNQFAFCDPAVNRAWSDIETVGARQREPQGTKGLETHVRRDALCELLRATKSQLIIKTWASRYKRDRNRLRNEQENSEQRIRHIYLFDPDVGLIR